MEDNVLVSIVTPCYNSEKFLEETIQAVLNQTYPNIQYIIVDGLSSDATPQIIAKYAEEISEIISEHDAGMYDAINKGLKRAKGEIVCYINSDDVYPKDTIEKVVAFFKENPDTHFVYGDLDYIDENSKHLQYYSYPDFHFKHFISLWFSSIPQPSSFWRQNVHKEVGYFNNELKMCGDFDFFARVAQKFSIYHSKKIIVHHRRHSFTLTNTNSNLNKEEQKRIRKKYRKLAGLSKIQSLYFLIIGYYLFRKGKKNERY